MVAGDEPPAIIVPAESSERVSTGSLHLNFGSPRSYIITVGTGMTGGENGLRERIETYSKKW